MSLEDELEKFVKGVSPSRTEVSELESRLEKLESANQQPDQPPTTMPEKEYAVGESAPFSTIQEAWDSVEGSKRVSIVLQDDYDHHAEDNPARIEIPQTDDGGYPARQVTISSESPNATQIGVEGSNKTALIARGSGSDTYREPFEIRDVTIKGGGIRVSAWPFSRFKNLVMRSTSHGMTFAPDNRGEMYGSTIQDCQAWNCGGDGFKIHPESGAHGTTMKNIVSTANGGAGVRPRGYKISIDGGVIQMNHDYGIDLRGAHAFSLENVYFEGNGRDSGYPVSIYGDGNDSISIKDCYFTGINTRGATHEYDLVQRAINLWRCNSVTIKDNMFRRFGDSICAFNECTKLRASEEDNSNPGGLKFS